MHRKGYLALTVVAAISLLVASCGQSPQASASLSATTGAASGEAQLAELRPENHRLKQALLAQTRRTAALAAHVGAPGGVHQLGDETAAEAALYSHRDIQRLVQKYFQTVLRARAPGGPGTRGRADLGAFFTAGSPALDRVRYVALGKLAASENAAWPEGMETRSLAVVRKLTLMNGGRRAVVVVYPVSEFWTYIDADGKVRSGEFDVQTDDRWNATMWDGPHRLSLVRRSGGWTIADDFSVGADGTDVPALMKAGGARRAVWRAEARRIAARTRHTIPVPDGVRATFERFLTLLNEHRYAETDALFIGGRGYRARMFGEPYGDWRYSLKRIGGFDPLSEIAVSISPDIPFVVEASGPADDEGGYNHAGGGMFGPSMRIAHKVDGGRWLIEGAGTRPPIGAGGYPKT